MIRLFSYDAAYLFYFACNPTDVADVKMFETEPKAFTSRKILLQTIGVKIQIKMCILTVCWLLKLFTRAQLFKANDVVS